MKILGISAYYHDSAACLIIDGQVVAAAQEERFTRVKHDASFPTQAIRYCLQHAGIALDELDAIAYYEKPLLKFERILRSHIQYAPWGVQSFIRNMHTWLSGKLFFKRHFRSALRGVDDNWSGNTPLYFPSHHQSHAASAYYTSTFESAAVLTIDGVGELATASIAQGNGREIRLIAEQQFPHSLGLFYSACTAFLGFKVNNGEYKVMGLAPYGQKLTDQVQHFQEQLESHIIQIGKDGHVGLNQDYFRFDGRPEMIIRKRWEQLLNIPKRAAESELCSEHHALAAAVQNICNKAVIRMAQHALKVTGENKLCLAGGVALNCVSNAYLMQHIPALQEVYIQPAAGDAGGALGAALVVQQQLDSKPMQAPTSQSLGPSYSDDEIEQVLIDKGLHYQQTNSLAKDTVRYILNNKVVGFFQGRMEFGPRALGYRSILANPCAVDMQAHINKVVKRREAFRPFAPAVLHSAFNHYFEGHSNAHMTLTAQFKPAYQCQFPAVCHVDGSARVQLVYPDNPMHALLLELQDQGAPPMLLNTSFNRRGEPMVCQPQEAIDCFLDTEMDVLVIGSFILEKPIL